jgi:hypothetical protein
MAFNSFYRYLRPHNWSLHHDYHPFQSRILQRHHLLSPQHPQLSFFTTVVIPGGQMLANINLGTLPPALLLACVASSRVL